MSNEKKSLSSFTFFYRYLFSKRANSVIRRVSFICFLGLMISIGSLLIVLNVMGGLGQSIKDQFLATEPHVIVSLEKNSDSHFIQNQKDKIEKILKKNNLDTGISSFYFFENVDIVIRTSKGIFSGAVAKGYDSYHLKNFLRKTQGTLMLSAEGDILDDIPAKGKKSNENDAVGSNEGKKSKEDFLEVTSVEMRGEKLFFVKEVNKKERPVNRKTIVMGLDLAGELNLYQEETVQLIPAENLLLPPGEPVLFELARVGSIISIQNSVWNSNYIFYDRGKFPSFRESSSYGSGFEIGLKEPDDFLLYKTALEKAGFTVEVWPERNSSVFFALKVEKIIMSIFLSLAGLITLLAVSSLLALLIVQKKKEMGILMAMGLPVKKIRDLFVRIGLILCVFGILGAWFLSICACLFLKYSNVPFLSQFYAGAQFPVEFNFLFMLGLSISVLLLAYVSCALSVRFQFRYSPSELLKTANG